MSKIISRVRSLCLFLLLASLAANLAFAQGAKVNPSHSVLAATSTEQVRFTALGEVYQLRLEVFSATGEMLFDSEFKPGNFLDWNLQDKQGQRLAEGAYRCVVTTKNLTGQTYQKYGEVLLQADQVALQAPGQDKQAIQAANTLPAFGQLENVTILGKESVLPLALLAHDGEQARIVSGRGGLSFRTGDFFAGKDIEQLRLTPEGKLGLGVVEPQAKLDVGGLIRTNEGIVFPDGSVQTTAYVAPGRAIGERAGMQRDVQGRSITEAGESVSAKKEARLAPNGTFNRVAKFAADGTTLIDSNIIETASGDIGIGGMPGGVFDLQRASSGDLLQRFWNTNTGSGGAKLRYVAATGATSQLQLTDNAEWLMAIAGNNSAGLQFRVRAPSDPNTEAGLAAAIRMSILRNGNVGIGTTSPQTKLDVAGNGLFSSNVSIGGTDGSILNPNVRLHVDGPSATTNVETAQILQLTRPVVPLVKNTNSAGFSVGSFEMGILGRTRLDIKLSGLPVDSNAYGRIPDVTVMSLQADGTVGIGTSTPSAQLEVISESDKHGVASYSTSTSTTSYGVFGFSASSHGIYGYSTKSQGNGVYGYNNFGIGVKGESGSSFGVLGTSSGTGVLGQTTGANGIAVHGQSLSGGANYGVVGSSISSTGFGIYGRNATLSGRSEAYVGTAGVWGDSGTGIGVYATSDTNYAIAGVSGSGGKAGYFSGNVVVTGAVCAANITCASDARLKEQIRSHRYGLSHLLQLRPVSWKWKDPKMQQLSMGLIAQEVEGVIPELVLRDADPAKPLGLNYLGLMPVVIKAIQEQQTAFQSQQIALGQKDATLKSLKAENAALQQHNAELDARLTALEQAMQQLLGQQAQAPPGKRQQ